MFSCFFVDPISLWLWILVFVIGTMFGSFFNALIYRIPRNMPFVLARSFCPACGHRLSAWDLIPIVSFLSLGAKCRYCAKPISWRYPIVELITALWFCFLFRWLTSANYSGEGLFHGILIVLLFLFFIPIIWIDIGHSIIPDVFTLPGIALGILVSLAPGGITPLQSIAGMFSGSLPLLAVGWIGLRVFKKEEAMGGGDIKMMGAIGALLGAKTALFSLLSGSVLASIGGVFLLLLKGTASDRKISFGPYLTIGTIIAFFWGNRMMNYLWNV